MKWTKHPKGEKRTCPCCDKAMHTMFEREDGVKACGRCFREKWQEGDVVKAHASEDAAGG